MLYLISKYILGQLQGNTIQLFNRKLGTVVQNGRGNILKKLFLSTASFINRKATKSFFPTAAIVLHITLCRQQVSWKQKQTLNYHCSLVPMKLQFGLQTIISLYETKVSVWFIANYDQNHCDSAPADSAFTTNRD